MFVLRHGGRRMIPSSTQSLRPARCFASRIDIPFTPPPFPVIESCPSPACQCRDTPAGLDIEREQNINGSMASYAQQVLISTGRSDWKSRIEEEDDAVLVKVLKSLIGPKGKYSDPYHNVMITNSSFPPTSSPAHHGETSSQTASVNRSKPVAKPDEDPALTQKGELSPPAASAFLLPSFEYVPTIPTDPSAVEEFVKAFILPANLPKEDDERSRKEKNIDLRGPERKSRFTGSRQVDEILVLICGHGARDDRCGQLGPILQAEFEEKLERQNVALLHDAPVADAEITNTEAEGYVPTARVGLISHIGGHKWAGNVIVYIPPSFKRNPLRGKGIWYGRVGPEQVEGIVNKTIIEGKVIKDLFRGGIDRREGVLRL